MIDQLDKLVKEANETASNAKKESEAAKTLAEKYRRILKTIPSKSLNLSTHQQQDLKIEKHSG